MVGASIAGPMVAYWLAKAGARVTVIERYPHLRTGGQNIDIRLTGVTVMRKIPGMEEVVRANLAPIDGLSMIRQDGTPIAVMRATGNPEQQSLVSEYEIFRGNLSAILYDLTKDNTHIKYLFNEQINTMIQEGDGPIKVTFMSSNQNSSTEYDLVVACDGATSRTRAMGLECGIRDHIIPTGAWAAYFSIKQDLLDGQKIGRGLSAPGGRMMAAIADPSGNNRIIAWSSHQSIDNPVLEEFREAQKTGTEEVKKLVFNHFKGIGWRAEEILQEMIESEDFYASEICQVKVPALSKGRFVLVGDAGYASGPTGTGTSLAMAGAYILAGEICQHRGDFAKGLKAYEERMQPIIKDMQVLPPGILSFMAPQTAWGIEFRNLLFKVVCWGMSFSGLFTWLTSFWGTGFSKDKHNLPDYEWVI